LTESTGNILKQKRSELGLSIKEVSAETKIREDFIAAIEENNEKAVPSSYYKLFLKKYASFLNVKLSEPEKFEEDDSDHIYEMLSRHDENDRKNHFLEGLKRILLFGYVHRKIFFSFIALFFVMLFIRHIYLILNTGVKTEKSESMVKIITIEGDPDERISVDIRDSIMIDEEKTDFFTLRITAADSCYVCFFYDTLAVKETIILPGRYMDLKVERLFEAKLGKSDAVSVEFNKNRVLDELKQFKNASSFIKATHFGAERIRRSDKINEYLKETYGLE
jgi:transcriptional regulator with XRE-family HTH domain